MTHQGPEYQAIFSYLRSLNFHFSDKWVIECVNYYKSTNPNISLDTLKYEVKQQWLLVNLREIKVPCLPPNLTSIEKTILRGKYAVQVESMIDSSQSCYCLFQQLQNICTDKIEEIPDQKQSRTKTRRCLTFVISDGVQELQAMEYQAIKKIKTNDRELLPGFKMIIEGPVECRKGMILLKDDNVRVCGGEVDSLRTCNSLRSILIKKLDLNESDYSQNSCNRYLETEYNNEDEIQTHLVQSVPTCDVINASESVENLLSQNDDVFINISLDSEMYKEESYNKSRNTLMNSGCQSGQSSFINSEITANRNIFECETDLNFVNTDNVINDCLSKFSKKHSLSQEDMQFPREKRMLFNKGSENSSREQLNEYIPNDVSASLLENNFIVDNLLEAEFQCQNESKSNLIFDKKKPEQNKLPFFYKSSNTYRNSAINTYNLKSSTIFIDHNPFLYLKQIMSIKLLQPTVFTVKCIILTLTKKITIENNEFNLKGSITDGSLSIDVSFSSSILEDMLGYNPNEMKTMMKNKQTNHAVSAQVKEAFVNTQEKLISLNCLMKLKFFPDEKCPVVLSTEEVTLQHLNALKARRI